MKTFGKQTYCSLDIIKPYQRRKLSHAAKGESAMTSSGPVLNTTTGVGCSVLLDCFFVMLIIILAVLLRGIVVLHKQIREDKKRQSERRENIRQQKQMLGALFESMGGSV